VRSPAAICAAWRKAGVVPPRDREARRLARLHPRDVFIHLPETAKESGSFGDGVAPYA